ncbi:asparaginase [Planoprotostelium fungivorum]|uniref:beta-aspartyl-peptidase n=1 Tax=Planoprotostelium fungivorum TaxID=1890364 RepID=A0A2P6N9W9_9EUKA|nr:asparaginase [Planoprotostelium fungivorum]
MTLAIAIHGGAGVVSRDISDQVRQEYIEGLSTALRKGWEVLQSGGSAVDAVEASVESLEGRGSVFTSSGTHEMDASIMDGNGLRCGAIGGVSTVRNPIRLARKVMDNSPHVFFAAAGAEAFAREQGFDITPVEHFYTKHRHDQLQDAKRRQTVELSESELKGKEVSNYNKGTVGAVALDSRGNLAAATSTGGMTNKKAGRIGDSPIIGAGTYAANGVAAVSATGLGEQFIRHAVSHSIIAAMDYGKMTLREACDDVVHKRLNEGDGGVIALNAEGEVYMPYNSEGMFRASITSNSNEVVKIWE